MEDFDWIKDINPRQPTDINVDDYFYIINNGSRASDRIRYILRVFDIYKLNGRDYVYTMPLVIDDFFDGNGEIYFDDETGEVYGTEEQVPSTNDYIDETEEQLLTLKRAKELITSGYWIYVEDPYQLEEYGHSKNN